MNKEGGLTFEDWYKSHEEVYSENSRYMDPIRIEFKISIPIPVPTSGLFLSTQFYQEKKKAREALREDFARLCRERAGAVNRSWQAAKPELQMVDLQFDEEEEDD